ncbi:MAG TPA: hypothetical protein DCF65_10740 [Chloroflexi bacterium]|jgi:hypothetical protein|nr:hypothetical protein [Chloroflexota bacterium]HAF20189.1 hypothetical protein [Chloroflexota bacterium]
MALELAGAAGVLAALLVAAIALGLIGQRRRSLRVFLAWIGPLYSLGILAYFLFEGVGSQCDGAGATFHCWEISYASTWGLQGSVMVALLVLLSLAPLLSVLIHRRAPAVVAAIAMPLVFAVYLPGLWPWAPAWAAALGAAIAGPPSREASAKDPAGLRV